jgi:hypothetical protein
MEDDGTKQQSPVAGITYVLAKDPVTMTQISKDCEHGGHTYVS